METGLLNANRSSQTIPGGRAPFVEEMLKETTITRSFPPVTLGKF